MANEPLIKEKSKANSEIRKDITKFVFKISELAMAYKYLQYKFRFDANAVLYRKMNTELDLLASRIFNRIRSRGGKVAEISREDISKKYGIDYLMGFDEIDGFLDREIEGEKTEDRIVAYCSQIKDELEAHIATGLVASSSSYAISASFSATLDKPLSTPAILAAIGSGLFAASALKKEAVYGKGTYASGFKNLVRMDYDVSQRIYIQNTVLGFGTNKLIAGVIPRRSSSIPCQLCDEVAGKIFSVSSLVLPRHPRCICYLEPVLVNGKEFSKFI